MALAWDSDFIITSLELDIAGASIETPRAISGNYGAIDMTGGGYWTARGTVDLFTDAAHRAWMKLKAYLDGGVGVVDLPLNTEKFGLVPDPSETITQFIFNNTASEGDTSVTLRVTSTPNHGNVLTSGMIFGVHHSSIRSKAYIIRDVTDVTEMTDRTIFDVNIRPPLRFDTPSSTVANLSPLVQMRLMGGTSLPWPVMGNEYHRARASFSMIEAIPTDQ